MSAKVGKPVQVIRLDYSSTNVTTGAWVQLSSGLDQSVREISVFDSSGRVLQLGTGASGSEVAIPFYITPGGFDLAPCIVEKGVRLAIKAVDASATTGQLVINFYA